MGHGQHSSPCYPPTGIQEHKWGPMILMGGNPSPHLCQFLLRLSGGGQETWEESYPPQSSPRPHHTPLAWWWQQLCLSTRGSWRVLWQQPLVSTAAWQGVSPGIHHHRETVLASTSMAARSDGCPEVATAASWTSKCIPCIQTINTTLFFWAGGISKTSDFCANQKSLQRLLQNLFGIPVALIRGLRYLQRGTRCG